MSDFLATLRDTDDARDRLWSAPEDPQQDPMSLPEATLRGVGRGLLGARGGVQARLNDILSFSGEMQTIGVMTGALPLDTPVDAETYFERLTRTQADEAFWARNRLTPDPARLDWANEIIMGVSEALTVGTVGELAGGPLGSAALLANTYGESSYRSLIEQGVDENTATGAALREGGFMGLMGALPVAIPGRLGTRIVTGAGMNAATGVAMRYTVGSYLEENGYSEIAKSYAWADSTALLTDMALGGLFGGIFGRRTRGAVTRPGPDGEPVEIAPTEWTPSEWLDVALKRAEEGDLTEAYAFAKLAEERGAEGVDDVLADIAARRETPADASPVEEDDFVPLTDEEYDARTDDGFNPAEEEAAFERAYRDLKAEVEAAETGWENLTSEERAAVLVLAGAKQRDLDSAPGIPTNPAAQRAHSDALNRADAQMGNGEPVDVSGIFQDLDGRTRESAASPYEAARADVLGRLAARAADIPVNEVPVESLSVARPKQGEDVLVSAREAVEDGMIRTSWAELEVRAGRDMIVGEAQNDARPVRRDIFDLTYEEAEPGLFRKRADAVVGWFTAENEMTIRTLEGDVIARPGDKVLIGAVGEMWPVRAEKFAERYDVIELGERAAESNAPDFIPHPPAPAEIRTAIDDAFAQVLEAEGFAETSAELRRLRALAEQVGEPLSPEDLLLSASRDLSATARAAGYRGNDTGEAREWIAAKAKGLDMSFQARMERARTAGFRVRAYRGSVRPPPTKAPRSGVRWYATSAETANTYAGLDEDLAFSVGAGNVEAVLIRPTERRLIVNARGKRYDLLTRSDLPDVARDWSLPTRFEAEDVAFAAKQNGYSEVTFRDMRDAGTGMSGAVDPTDIYGVMDMANVRSIHAAFDPERADEANMLASASGGEASVAALDTALSRSFGGDYAKLKKSAKVEVVGSVDEVPGLRAALDKAGAIGVPGAVHVRSKGKTYMIASGVDPDRAARVLLHEVGVHHGMAKMLGAKRWDKLTGEISRLVDAGHPAAKEAAALAETFALNKADVPEETLAYLVENAPELPMVKRLIADIRQWLWRTFGSDFGMKLTVDDIRAMAVASLRRVAREAVRKDLGVEIMDPALLGDEPAMASAKASGFEGSDIGEAREWVSAVRKGLDMSLEARMARAREMGFREDTAYRGIVRPYDAAKAGRFQWFTSSAEDAGEYAGDGAFDGGNILAARIRSGRELKITGNGRNFTSIDTGQLPAEVRARLHPSIGDVARSDDIADAAQKAGYDSVRIENVFDNRSGEIPRRPAQSLPKGDDDLFAELEAAGFDMTPAERAPKAAPEIARNYDPVTVTAVFDPSNIRSIHAAFDPDRTGEANILANFAGLNAGNANTESHRLAKEMEKAGKSRGYIWQQTGWARGLDNEWRWEIPSDDMVVNRSLVQWSRRQTMDTPLADILDWPSLFQAYPFLENIRVSFADKDTKSDGSYWDRGKQIMISRGRGEKKMLSTLRHEIQHAIQAHEGWPSGYNPNAVRKGSARHSLAVRDLLDAQATWRKMVRGSEVPTPEDIADAESHAAYAVYANEMGELEARDVQNRNKERYDEAGGLAAVTASERAAVPPNDMFDISKRKALIWRARSSDGDFRASMRSTGRREPPAELPDPGSEEYATMLADAQAKEKEFGTPALNELEKRIVRQNRDAERAKMKPVEQAVQDEPTMEIDGLRVETAIERAAAEEQSARDMSKGYDAAINCAIRHGGYSS